jgi:hypothetical protein
MTVASTAELNGYTYAVHKPEPAIVPNVCHQCMKLINTGDSLVRLEVVDQSCRDNRFPKFHEHCFTESPSDAPTGDLKSLFEDSEWKVKTFGKGHHWVVDPTGTNFQSFSVKEKAEGFVETMNNLNGGQAAMVKKFVA